MAIPVNQSQARELLSTAFFTILLVLSEVFVHIIYWSAVRLCITRLRCRGRLYFRIGNEGVGDADVGELRASRLQFCLLVSPPLLQSAR
jgi:hypothetical protein